MLYAAVSMWTDMVGGVTWQHAAVIVRIWTRLVTGEGGAKCDEGPSLNTGMMTWIGFRARVPNK